MDRNGHTLIDMKTLEKQSDAPSRQGRGIEMAEEDAEPFIPPSNGRPPLAHPEHDSDEAPDTEIPFTPESRPGIDDGFFPSDFDTLPPLPEKPNGIAPRGPNGTDDVDQPFPQASDFGSGVININGVPTVVPDVNVYQHKKTLAQGMMDLALLSANANQLRYVLESYNRHPYYYASLIFIVTSLLFQVAVGIGLIMNSRYDVKDKKEICHANRINNLTVIGIFIVTVVNVFISAFGVADPPPDMKA